MSNKLNRGKLQNIYNFQYGKGNTIENIGGDYPIYGSNGIVGYTNKFNSESSPVIGHIGAYAGIVNWANGKHYVTYNGVICKIKKSADSKFGYYSLLNANVQRFVRGSTQPFVSYDLINEIEIWLPNIETQQKIAAVLCALDNKIELNNQINTELEAMAKTLYDYWFVQFDFPDENGKPYKSSGGKMVFNEVLKREIPVGWEVTVFNDWISKTKTGDWGKEAVEGNYTEHVYCVRGADINGLNGKGEVKAPERFILKNNLVKSLKPNDFVVEISGGSPTQSTGRIALLTEASLKRFDSNVICSNFCKALSLKDDEYVFNFLQEWQRLYDAGVFFGYEGKTSGIKNFLFDSFMTSYDIVKPPKNLVEKFYKKVETLENKKQINLQQNQELAQFRDWLLPMLMNGQVRVGSGEYEMEEGGLGMVAEWKEEYKIK